MAMITRLILLVCATSCIAQAKDPYKEVERVLTEINALEGQTISVHGAIDKIEKDLMSAKTVVINLEGGIRCRISRDTLKIKAHEYGPKPGPVKYMPEGSNGLKLKYQDTPLFSQGTDVIIRGTVKKELTKWIIDRAVIRGCSDSATRSLLGISCEAPCARSSYFYLQCVVCRDPET